MIECKDLKSADTFGKNDVYVELKMKDYKSLYTTVKDDAGSSAVINETFELYYFKINQL